MMRRSVEGSRRSVEGVHSKRSIESKRHSRASIEGPTKGSGKGPKGTLMIEEDREEGQVGWKVYRQYVVVRRCQQCSCMH